MKHLAIMTLLLLTNLPAVANDAFTNILKASAGTWQGQLYYLDYQSGRRFGIPIQIDAELTPDSATLVRKLTYTDPGVLVYAVNLSTKDRDTGELLESYFREGKADLFRYKITAADYTSETEWSLRYQHNDIDDEQPALIRHTISRNGEKMSSTKEVMFRDKPNEFILRNGTELTLVR